MLLSLLNTLKAWFNLVVQWIKSMYTIESKSVKIAEDKEEEQILDPLTIPKFQNELIKPPVFEPTIIRNIYSGRVVAHKYEVDITEFDEQMLPEGFPKTRVWGYAGVVRDYKTGKKVYFKSSPGSTFEAVRGITVRVKWNNKLKCPHMFAVDPTIHWANPNDIPIVPPMPWPSFPPGFRKAQYPVPIVTHLHGGENLSIYDGHPDAWYTHDGKRGPEFVTEYYHYQNTQQPTTLWYHDHTLGITRLNVYAGLAGFYLLRDEENIIEKKLPKGQYEIPIVIQDKTFKTDGALYFDSDGVNPDIHPYWNPEFFGNTIVVNGKVWPNLNVEKKKYRFRFLNGSNARFYNVFLSNELSMTQIGTDGGFLENPVELTSLLIAPGERADIIIDFSQIPDNTKIILKNDASFPFPDGETPDPNTTGQIMQFTVKPSKEEHSSIPQVLNTIPKLSPDVPKRILTLVEVMGTNGPVELLLNGQKWSAPISEIPRVGSTEEWEIVNLTADTHPIHLHLVQFLIKNRQDIDTDSYYNDWIKINNNMMLPFDKPTIPLSVENYLVEEPVSPDDNERGWKDTVRMNPGQVTRILVRFAPQDIPIGYTEPGLNFYPFDPSCGPGYVWHCHILDHEDNEMMRPYIVKP